MQDNWLQSLRSIVILTVTLNTAATTMPTLVFADTHADTVAAGQKLAFDSTKGNCIACHKIEGGEFPGNIAPVLKNVKKLYPNIDKLRAQIWDATVANSATVSAPIWTLSNSD